MITQIAGNNGIVTPRRDEDVTPARRRKRHSSEVTVEPLYLRVGDAARLLCISRSSLYALMEQGQIVFAKFGRSRRVPKAALDEYQRRCLVGSIGAE